MNTLAEVTDRWETLARRPDQPIKLNQHNEINMSQVPVLPGVAADSPPLPLHVVRTVCYTAVLGGNPAPARLGRSEHRFRLRRRRHLGNHGGATPLCQCRCAPQLEKA